MRTPATRLLLMGIAATLAGIGLGRFAYAALLPGLIESGWLSESQASFAGAANLLGYLLGAVCASRVGQRWGASRVIRLSTLLVAISFLASSWAAPVWWFSLWRLVAGVTGAFLMVLTPSLVLHNLPVEKRKQAGSLIFTGVGIGVLLSATLAPALLHAGTGATWLAIGLVALIPVVLVWQHWPAPDHRPAGGHPPMPAHASRALLLVYLCYALDAGGFVPHTVFWVDFLEHHRGFSHWQAGMQWGLFAVGALCGPFLIAAMARLLGWQWTFFTALGTKGTAILLPFALPGLISTSLSSFLVGALIPGMVASTAGRVSELVSTERYPQSWGRATAIFALMQAISAYVMAALYSRPGGDLLIFWLGGSLLLLAALIQLGAGLMASPRSVQHRH
ncbi:major facilitator family transporter [Alcanivorax hongdengensis A-11-3]|uniref:Major facilitator family transporter n=1 Tax=Alcanivorax hongdengensis A-11-3 TaxID=1177179 RepID=L0WFM3_9GAMM|nr:YbfB/YjiJ family MFS transporter [Alcanivorax hongdengensis]EKF75504.1 major facilitator family transporter [Alcanivorax hongdengensis A-11-3]